MRTTSLLAAALLAITQTVSAIQPIVELYPDSEDCTGRKITIKEPVCQNQLIRGSGKVLQGGVWGFYGADCTSQMVGVMTAQHGCWLTYPGYFSFKPVTRCIGTIGCEV